MIDADAVIVAVEPGLYVKRSVRLMLIDRDIRAGRYYTVDALADKYGVSKDSIYRDLKTLQAAPLRVPMISLCVWGIMPGEDCN